MRDKKRGEAEAFSPAISVIADRDSPIPGPGSTVCSRSGMPPSVDCGNAPKAESNPVIFSPQP